MPNLGKRPAVMTALRSKADLVRQIAAAYGLSYDEAPVPNRDDLITFFFKHMNDAATHELETAVANEVCGYRLVRGILQDLT
jgi:hypothetical protein